MRYTPPKPPTGRMSKSPGNLQIFPSTDTYTVSATRTKPAYKAHRPAKVHGLLMNRATRRLAARTPTNLWVQR